MFDDDNGFFFEDDGTNTKVVRRTKTSGAVVDNVFTQGSGDAGVDTTGVGWNIDQLDGLGPSGVTLDVSKDNIFIIDFQALYAGRIRYGFDFGGQITYFHQIQYANTATVPFVTNANLPFRVAIKNTAAAASSTNLDFFCFGIASEGGFNPLGVMFSTNNGVTKTAVTTRRPVLTIRPNPEINSIVNRGIVLPQHIDLLSIDQPILFEIVANGTITGTWTNVDADSIVQFDTASSDITGGQVIYSGYLAANSKGNTQNPDSEEHSLMSKQVLSVSLSGTALDTCSIVITSLDVSASNVLGAMTWKEIY